MVLLTSSQVQVLLSSAIITAFTFLLFLSGYVIQQRTVQGLQAAIRPRAPFPHVQTLVPAMTDPRVKASRPFGRLKDYAKLQLHLQEQEKAFSWDRLAYAQVVREHSEVCDALILFGELYRSKSPVPKLLLFPAAWISDKDESNQEWETTQRLLRKATRRYRATLVPIKGSEIWENPREKNLFILKDYERVISLPPPGLVLNSLPLDTLLAYHQTGEAISAYPPVEGNGSGNSMVITNPSAKHIPTLPFSTIPSIFSSASNPDLPLPSIFSNIVSLRMPYVPSEPFNATKFLSQVAYMHISDPELPGPEYDLPYYEMVRRRSEDEDQSYLWEKMYSTYKDRRYEVCGLDLETWPPTSDVGDLDTGEQRTDL